MAWPRLSIQINARADTFPCSNVKVLSDATTKILTDASRLPKSTGRQGIPAPPPKPEELVTVGCWEENETEELPRGEHCCGRDDRSIDY